MIDRSVRMLSGDQAHPNKCICMHEKLKFTQRKRDKKDAYYCRLQRNDTLNVFKFSRCAYDFEPPTDLKFSERSSSAARGLPPLGPTKQGQRPHGCDQLAYKCECCHGEAVVCFVC